MPAKGFGPIGFKGLLQIYIRENRDTPYLQHGKWEGNQLLLVYTSLSDRGLGASDS